MTPKHVLARPPLVLEQAQRQAYFKTGYLLSPGFIDRQWLDRIREVSTDFVEQSRVVSESDAKFDVESGHTADTPKLRRFKAMHAALSYSRRLMRQLGPVIRGIPGTVYLIREIQIRGPHPHVVLSRILR